MLVYQNATVFVLKYFFRYFHLFITLIKINYFCTPKNELNAHNFVKYQDILIIFVAINPVNIWLVEPVNNSKPDIWYVFICKDTIMNNLIDIDSSRYFTVPACSTTRKNHQYKLFKSRVVSCRDANFF